MVRTSSLISLLHHTCAACAKAGDPMSLDHLATMAALLRACETGTLALERYHDAVEAERKATFDNIVPFPERPTSAPPSGEAS